MNTYLGRLCFGLSLFLTVPQSFSNETLCSMELLGRRQFLSKKFKISSDEVKVAFFDADDTIRKTKSGKPAPDGPEDVMILPGIAKKIKRLNEAGYLVVIVSNQAGVQYGKSIENIDRAFLETIRLLRLEGAEVDYYDFAERNDIYRKPKTGMCDTLASLLKAQFGSKVKIDRRKSFMVGDAAGQIEGPKKKVFDSDLKFAQNFGIAFYEAKSFRDSPELFPKPKEIIVKVVRDSAPKTDDKKETTPPIQNQPVSAAIVAAGLAASEEEIEKLFDEQLPNRLRIKDWEFAKSAWTQEMSTILSNPPAGFQWIPLSFFSGGSQNEIPDLAILAKRNWLIFSHSSAPSGNLNGLIQNENAKTHRGFLDSLVLGKVEIENTGSKIYKATFQHPTNGALSFRVKDNASSDFTDSAWILMPAKNIEDWRRLAFERADFKYFMSDFFDESHIRALSKIFKLYAEVPPSYGSTAVAGTLKGRKVNDFLKKRPEYAEFSDLPYNHLFEMAQHVEKFILATTYAQTTDAGDGQYWIQLRNKKLTTPACVIYEKLSLELLKLLK